MRIVVVGAGPAGLAAAVTAAENGADVCLLDENPQPGGQIWRQGIKSAIPKAAQQWFRRLQAQKIESHFGMTVVGAEPGVVTALTAGDGTRKFSYDSLILATGARELFLPFPGWTLPNVMGCGGAQAFLKAGWPVKGLRLVVAGSGPLLLAVASAFKDKGAIVVGIVEQANTGSLIRFGASLLQHPEKLGDGMRYGWKCFPTMMKSGTWISRARGGEHLQSVMATNGHREWEWECDVLACGFGLIPNTELAESLGCILEAGRVKVDAEQRTSQSNIYSVGESTGIGGESVALLEGEIASLSILKSANLPSKIHARGRWNGFQRDLENCFRLRPEVLGLAESDTVVCRCEDVTFGSLKSLPNQRTAKLYTRCGMGPCQGRVCGPACRAIFGWELNKPRWPLVPVEMGALLS